MAQSPTAAEHDLLISSLTDVIRRTHCAVAFGGLTTDDETPLTAFVGAHGQSLNGLLIESAEGAGGLAMQDHRPVAATHYRRSATITHRYDREVTAEGIESLLAVPIVVDGCVRPVIYGAYRVATQLGDTVVHEAIRVSKALEWHLSVADEVDRRLALIETEGGEVSAVDPFSSERVALREVYAELRELSRGVADPELSMRLDAVRDLIMPRRGPSTRVLAPREIDMLANVALGKRNAQIGHQLGLTEATVKSYLSSAMRKLGSSNRYEAVIAARRAGLIP